MISCGLSIKGIILGLSILVASFEGFYNRFMSNSLASQLIVDGIGQMQKGMEVSGC